MVCHFFKITFLSSVQMSLCSCKTATFSHSSTLQICEAVIVSLLLLNFGVRVFLQRGRRLVLDFR